MSESAAPSCWTAQNARAVLATEALTGNDALFLATHAPLKGFRVEGTHASDIEKISEEGLLAALSKADLKHAFCVVQGEPGSGKSHLIRWLYVNWPGDDLVLLVQRANGSLDGTLRQLKGHLPDEFKHLFDRMGQQQVAGLAGRAMQFLLTLGGSLKPDFFEVAPEDASWCRDNDPMHLILNSMVRDSWRGPRRILELMDGAKDRNSESASFNLSDILDLARHCSEVHDSAASEKLARRLVREADQIRQAREAGKTWEEIQSGAAGPIESSLRLIDALNRRRNHAVQSVIGISAEGLKRLFEDLRVALAGKRRVVLLLEDITSWQGLDDSLVDALVTDATTRQDGDLCPLISVVGVTSDYFDKLAGNYRQRITHNIGLGDSVGRFEDVASLRGPQDRSAFVARYLSAARAGPEALAIWREAFRADHRNEAPNSCIHCRRREGCHAAFGDVGGVGLFPFTSDAVEGFFSALRADDGGMTHRTPRGILQGVLAPTLLSPHILDHGAYPGPEVESAYIERRLLPAVLNQRLEMRVEAPDDRQRYRRLLAYWGNLRAEAVRDASGDERYAGVKLRVVEAFRLPRISGEAVFDSSVPTNPPAASFTPDIEEADLEPPVDTTQAPQDQTVTASAGDAERRRTVQRREAPVANSAGEERPRAPAGQTGAKGVSRRELEAIRKDIEAIRVGATITNPTTWNNLVYEFVRKIDPRRVGLDRFTFAKVFTPELVKIEQTGSQRGNHFVVPREEWLLDGLEAFAALRTDTETPGEEAEYLRRRLAYAMRRLETLAAAHVRDRSTRLADGTPFVPVAAIVQILLLRAWLRGTISAEATTDEQWGALLSDEDVAEVGSSTRHKSWQDVLAATNHHHQNLRRALHDMVSLPQGDSNAFGIADASHAAAALVSLRDILTLVEVPEISRTAAMSGVDDVVSSIAAKITGLRGIPVFEQRMQVDRASSLFALLRGASVGAHLRRVDTTIRQISNALPSVAVTEVREWVAGYDRMRLLDDQDAVRQLEDFMANIEPESGFAWGRGAVLISRLAATPGSDLKATYDLAKLGEEVMRKLSPHVGDLIAEANRGARLSAIHQEGQALTAVLTGLQHITANHAVDA